MRDTTVLTVANEANLASFCAILLEVNEYYQAGDRTS